MESPRSHARRRMTLLANDDFWLTLADEVPPAKVASDGAIVGPCPDNEGGDEHSESEDSMPPLSILLAHKQLLPDEVASFEFLKGRDHTIDATSCLIPDGYAASNSDGSDEAASFEFLKGHDHMTDAISCVIPDGYATSDNDGPSFGRKEKLSDVKRRGGGSWLLGFARLNERPVSNIVPSSEEREGDSDDIIPGLVRVSEDDSSLESEDTVSFYEDDDSSEMSQPSPPRRRSVTFCETVSVHPVPHSSTLSPAQRRRMYSSSAELRRNMIRSKREWRYDGCDWRNATEEWEMGVDMITGELVHPANDMLCNIDGEVEAIVQYPCNSR